jgi:ArsR family transcriptional regulator
LAFAGCDAGERQAASGSLEHLMRDNLQSDRCARFLKALADPDRLKIVQCLQSGPKVVSDIAALLDKELANVSHHLGVLRHAGLVQGEKSGKYVIYSLHPDVSSGANTSLDLGCCRLDLTK